MVMLSKSRCRVAKNGERQLSTVCGPSADAVKSSGLSCKLRWVQPTGAPPPGVPSPPPGSPRPRPCGVPRARPAPPGGVPPAPCVCPRPPPVCWGLTGVRWRLRPFIIPCTGPLAYCCTSWFMIFSTSSAHSLSTILSILALVFAAALALLHAAPEGGGGGGCWRSLVPPPGSGPPPLYWHSTGAADCTRSGAVNARGSTLVAATVVCNGGVRWWCVIQV